MPDLAPLWLIGTNLIIYLIVVRWLFAPSSDDNNQNSALKWVFYAAVIFGFAIASVALLITAKSIALI